MKELRCHRGVIALVDDEDYDKARQYKWHITPKGYVRRTISSNGEKECLHNLVMNSLFVHHKDGNKLNNQKTNLVVMDDSTNSHLRQYGDRQYRGVNVEPSGCYVNIHHKGVRYYLGRFETPEEGARAYNLKAKELYGEDAYQNKINE